MEVTFDEETTLNRNGNKAGSTAKGSKGWQQVVIGGVTGIVLGSGSTVLMGMDTSGIGEIPGDENKDKAPVAESGKPSWAVGDINIASSVNDDMKFGEAFAAARAEVGPGGAFEWHGKVYGTYYADEWNSMSAQDKALFNDHFSWNHGHNASRHSSHANTDNHSSSESEVKVVSAESSAGDNPNAHHDNTANHSGMVDIEAFDSEVEVLGFVEDEETGAFAAGISVHGEEVVLVDFDGDLSFDVMATDINNNGSLEDNEVVDIQGAGITLDGLAGCMLNSTGNILTTGDILPSSGSTDIIPDTIDI